MKNESKIKSVILTLGIIFALSTIVVYNIIDNYLFYDETIENRDKTNYKRLKKSSGYSPDFIHIDGSIENNWSDTANFYTWCYGSGTWEQPYIIENCTIDVFGSPTETGIFINNSKNDYFIIRNCTVYNSSIGGSEAGIRLENTNNGTLTNNNCSDTFKWGIYLLNYCENNTISNNNASASILHQQVYGITLINYCNNNTIINNTLDENTSGIQVQNNCNNNTILENNATNNQWYGIFVYINSDSNTISENTIYNCDRRGIALLTNSNDNTVSGNTANDGRYGIWLNDGCNNNTISGNIANDNYDYGIYLDDGCDNNTISGNTANDNGSYGIYFNYGCNNNNITGNTEGNNLTTNQKFFLYFFVCDNNTISGNTANDNDIYGIYLYNSYDNTISGNTANDNIDAGISLLVSDDNNIKNNTINRNSLGILLDQSNNNTVSENTLIDNEYCIFEFECLDNIIENNNCSTPTVQEPIFIDGTATGVGAHNWNWAKSQPWCSGSGTWSDPYVIENLKISGFGLFNGIEIRNSNVSFIIQNCTVFNSDDSGIYFYNVNNSRLMDNNFHNNSGYGIYFVYSNNNTISGNTANGNELGIYLDNSDNNTISGNTAKNNELGILLEVDCNNNTISGNIINDNSWAGILLEDCNNNTISGNVINDNDYWGIYLYDCDNNTIANNAINNNGDAGIYLDSDNEYNEITENILYNNTWGIDIREGNSNNSVYENFFLKNGKHANDDGTDNKWNSTTIGNYWDNHTGPDTTPQDGIVDYPYMYISGSAGSIDYLPIAEDGAPRITINSPLEGSGFSTIAPNFSVTISEDYLESMWYTIDGGLNNYTFTENGMINQSEWDGMAEGGITLTFYARDIPGYTGSVSVNIVKDTVAPIIIINSPAEGKKFGNTAPLFNITITEDNLDAIWYSFDGGLTNYTLTNNGTFNQTAWAALAQGEVIITFYARDIAGNEASESVTVIKSIPSGLDPGVIITIVIVSIVGGVAVISIVYIFMKKRATPE